MKREDVHTKAAAYEPPKHLTETILAAIRQEKRRRRALLIRNFAAVAAALLLLTPAVTVLLPRLSGDPVENAPAAEDSNLLLDLTGATGPAVPTVADGTSADADDVPAPPDYVGKTDTFTGTTEDTVVALSTGAVSSADSDPGSPAPEETPLWMETVARLVGEKAFKEWLSQYEGDPYAPEAEAAAYAYFRLDV